MKHISKPSTSQTANWIDLILDGLNGNLSLQDNTVHQFLDITFNTSATYSTGDWTVLKLKVDPVRKVRGVLVLQCFPVAQIALDWTQVGGEVVLARPLGLSNSTSYKLSLFII